MDKKNNKINITTHTIKRANGKIVSEKSRKKGSVFRDSASGQFVVSRDEVKNAFKEASRKLKGAK